MVILFFSAGASGKSADTESDAMKRKNVRVHCYVHSHAFAARPQLSLLSAEPSKANSNPIDCFIRCAAFSPENRNQTHGPRERKACAARRLSQKSKSQRQHAQSESESVAKRKIAMIFFGTFSFFRRLNIESENKHETRSPTTKTRKHSISFFPLQLFVAYNVIANWY